VVLTRSDGGREEVDLEAGGRRTGEDETAAMPEPVATSAREWVADAADEAGPGGDV
jgi:hypothetical protein